VAVSLWSRLRARLGGAAAPAPEPRAGFGPPAYPSGGHGPRFSGFNDASLGANAALMPELRTLRNRSWSLFRSNAYVWKARRTRVAHIVGNGINPQSLHKDPKVRAAIEETWRISSEELDAYGLTNHAGLLFMLEMALSTPGEMFARWRERFDSDGLTVPFQVELLEGDHCPHELNEMRADGSRVRAGIVFANGRRNHRLGYMTHNVHPSDADPFGERDFEPHFVPASEMRHIFLPLRAGQLRGEPPAARILQPARDREIFSDGVVKKQQIASNHTGWLKVGDKDEFLASIQDENYPEMEWAPEQLTPMPGGVDDIKWTEPPPLGDGYADFMREGHHHLAAGELVPPWQVSGDYGAINYSSHRGGTVEQKRICMQEIAVCLVPMYLQPMWRRWFAAAVRVGALPISVREYVRNPRAYDSVRWVPTRWDWVDPAKEVAALVLACRAGFISRAQIIAEMGFDPELVDLERKHDAEREAGYGLVSDSNAAATSQSGQLQKTLDAIAKEDEREEQDNDERERAARAAQRSAA